MHQIRTEEKAALLLPEADDEEEQMDLSPIKSGRATPTLNDDPLLVVKKRPRTYHRYPSSSSQPVLCLVLILFAFILGCVSGVVVMLYRIAQDAEQTPAITTNSPSPSTAAARPDLSVRTKLFQSLSDETQRKNFSHSMRFDLNVAKNVVEEWKSLSSSSLVVTTRSYPLDLAKFSSSSSTNGIELIDTKTEKVLSKFDGLIGDEFLFLSSLVRSGTLNCSSIFYLNYGRHEDFGHLIKNKIYLENAEQSIGFIRRNPSLISVTEQIRHAVYFRFGAVVLFDDESGASSSTTDERADAFREWARSRNRIDRILFGISSTENRTTSILTLSLGNVQNIFASLQPDSNLWLPAPSQWHPNSTPMKIGGVLSTFRLRFVSQLEQIQTSLPVTFATIRGTTDPEHFLLVAYPTEVTQQNELLHGILRSFVELMKTGWKPKRSIVFSAWSGAQFDHFALRRWAAENADSIKGKLIGLLDLGHGVTGNSTLNLHGSPLFESIARRAADAVSSPLEHGHACHRRSSSTTMTTMAMQPGEAHQHDHGKRKRREETDCPTHKLLDEWTKTSNQTRNLVQMIDVESGASIFQLEFGFPSLLIEMTDLKDVQNDTFYARKTLTDDENPIGSETYVAYSQFVADVIRQLSDEIPLRFNLTIYAEQIDRYADDYFNHFAQPYQALAYHLGDPKELKKSLNELTKSMRQLQSEIEQIDANDLVRFSLYNAQLLEVESSFIFSNRTFFIDDRFKHFLLGPAFGLTNTAVPFPSLSNLLFNIPFDPSEEFCDAAVIYSSQLREQIRQTIQRLNGLRGLF